MCFSVLLRLWLPSALALLEDEVVGIIEAGLPVGWCERLVCSNAHMR